MKSPSGRRFARLKADRLNLSPPARGRRLGQSIRELKARSGTIRELTPAGLAHRSAMLARFFTR
jgi:hypothetical protein